MTGRFTVLASGSSGNAALLEVGGFGLLIDCGLHPRMLTARLAEVGANWDTLNAVILTHTHTDHWKDLVLADLRSRKVPLWAHAAHHSHLSEAAASFESLTRAKLCREYSANQVETITTGLTVRPIRVSHDSDPTFAFRIDVHDPHGVAWSLGYASDLGCWTQELVDAFAGVDVLAVEYNHDEKLERASPRPRFLVNRVLSDSGHLSNDQAAAFTTAVAARSGDGFPGHVVQLHLSKDCNRPELASATGRAALAELNPTAEIITARQHVTAKSIPLARHPEADNRASPRIPVNQETPLPRKIVQPRLPGFDE